MEMDQFDIDLIIRRMQDAVDIVNSSEHETSKVAACLFDPSGDPHSMISRTNHRPKVFLDHFDTYDRIGKSSQFVHAETACILEYSKSAIDHYLCVTDPFCPNCAKSIIESGVTRIFIDHKGMEKDFVKRRAGAFNLISLKMAQEAGIDVYILHRKERRFEPLILARSPQKPKIGGFSFHKIDEAAGLNVDSPLHLLREYLTIFAQNEHISDANTPMVLGFVTDMDGQDFRILDVRETLTSGMIEGEIRNVHPEDTDKYRFEIDAMNKMYFTLKRLRLKLVAGLVYSNRIPSSRAFVNAMLTDVKVLNVHAVSSAHDPHSLDVADILHNMHLLTITRLG